MIEFQRPCKACEGAGVQMRNDGIKIECPSCSGEGVIHIYPYTQPYALPTAAPYKPQSPFTFGTAIVCGGEVVHYGYE